MKKLKFNSTLDHKQSDYKTHEVIVENCTMTYKGVTSPIEVLYEKLNADNHQYFDGGKLLPGAVVSGIAKGDGIGHMWFYMGEFSSRDAVLDYLVKLGYFQR